MVQQENRRNTLFQKEKKIGKKRWRGITSSEQVQNLKTRWSGDPAFQTY